VEAHGQRALIELVRRLHLRYEEALKTIWLVDHQCFAGADHASIKLPIRIVVAVFSMYRPLVA